MNIAILILQSFLLVIHLFSLSLNVFALCSDLQSSSKQRDKYLKNMYIIIPMIVTDFLVLLTVADQIEQDFSKTINALDIYWIFTFTWDYIHSNTVSLVGLFKGVTSHHYNHLLNTLYLKTVIGILTGCIGLSLCNLSDKFYVHYFICGYFLFMQITNSIYAFQMKSKLLKLNLVYVKPNSSHTNMNSTERKTDNTILGSSGGESAKVSMENALLEIKSQFIAAFVLTSIYATLSIPLLIIFADGSFNSDLVVSLPQKLIVGLGTMRVAVLYIKKRDI